MLVLAKFSERMMTIYTEECIKNMPNEIMSTKMN